MDFNDFGSERARMDDRSFNRLSQYIQQEFGIKMPPEKRVLLENRLARRLRALSMPDYAAYVKHLFEENGLESELPHLQDIVSTHKTDFFREKSHFDYLENRILPEFAAGRARGSRERFLAWSSACSTGEEAWSLAITLAAFRDAHLMLNPPFDFTVLATDFSRPVLEKAETAIYTEESAEDIPEEYRRKYLLRSRDPAAGKVRLQAALRAKVRFFWLNLMDDDYRVEDHFHAIFCRNVLIYFDRDTQVKVVTRLARHLAPGGHLFIGHSESLVGLDLPFVQEAPTIYRSLYD